MKFFATALLIGTAAAPAALAQTTPTTPAPATQTAPQGPAVGVTVKDTAGGEVGKIEAINGELAVINTGTNKVSYPLTAMTATPTGPIIALTKAQLDASFVEQQAKAAAELQTRLAAGTEVFARDGTTKVGTIKAVDAEFVTLTTTAGKDVRLPKGGFATGRVGLVIGMTGPEFPAATAGA